MTVRIIPAIMSGGAGTRLWPLSTESKPKQFHALMGPRTMFAETVARLSGDVSGISFAPPMVLCGESHVAPARSALAEVNAKASAIVIEPAARNTAAVAAASAFVAQELDPSALVLLAPSDHVIIDTAAFHQTIECAAPFARERIVTFGMTPAHPAIGYGYIKRGAPLGDGVFAIEAFKEKPDEATARGYLEAGDYSWNSGMFLFSPATLLAEFEPNAAIRDCVRDSLTSASRSGDEIRLGAAYTEAQSLPLDIAVMERTARAAVAPCDIGWADIGSWVEVWRLAPRDADGFAVLGSAASTDTAKMVASGVKAVAIDGDDLVVVATDHGLLIAPRALAGDRDALGRAAQQL
jgi:mannose-1-phosphate guanylyltransferase/mannose-6-phosphate isomerase